MNLRQAAQGTRNIAVCEFLAVPANAALYKTNVAFSTIATKMQTDTDAAVVAGTNTGLDNTGYCVDKVIGKQAASEIAAQLCGSSKVKLDMIGNHALSDSLNSAASFYFYAKDELCTNRLMSAYNIMSENLLLITPDYLTPVQLTDFLKKINTYTTTKGSSTLVNNHSPVFTEAYNTAMKLTTSDVDTIKELAKFYKTVHPSFYAGIMRACTMPAVNVHHTPLVITITDASTTGVLANVAGTLTRTKELPTSNVAGIMIFATVSAGIATATFTKKGYISAIKTVNILRGKTNNYSVALVPGVMTAEQQEAFKETLATIIASEKAALAAKKKAKLDAKVAKVAPDVPFVKPEGAKPVA